MNRSKKPSGSMYLSIIIINYNTKSLLVECIRSIYSSTRLIDFEIIVVDNNSDDGSESLAKESFPDIILIKNQTNKGFAKANNQALQIARGKFILFLNPDIEILPQALNKTIVFLEKTTDVAMVGCRILNPDGSLQHSIRSFPSFPNYLFESLFLYKLFPGNRWTGRFYGTNFSYDRVEEVDVILGAYMMTTRQVLDEVGHFDERFFIYSEETDLCFRIKKQGRKVYFFPHAQIIHYGGVSASQYPVKMFMQDHLSRFLFMRKHYSTMNVILSTGIIFIGVCLRILFWSAASSYAFLFRKPFLKNANLKLRVFINLFFWYLRFDFVK